MDPSFHIVDAELRHAEAGNEHPYYSSSGYRAIASPRESWRQSASSRVSARRHPIDGFMELIRGIDSAQRTITVSAGL
jgi:hypothetical protein